MLISSRTPEGLPNRCPYCGSSIRIEPSSPLGDAPCPVCGQLLWFLAAPFEQRYFPAPDPRVMLVWLYEQKKLSSRKARLFAVACFRSILHLLDEKEAAVRNFEFAERLADGLATLKEQRGRVWSKAAGGGYATVMADARQAAENASQQAIDLAEERALKSDMDLCRRWSTLFFEAWAKSRLPLSEARRSALDGMPPDWVSQVQDVVHEQQRIQAHFLHDLFGHFFQPYRSVVICLLSPNVRALAETAYRDRIQPQGTLDPEKLKAMADALQEAGCHAPEVLDHLRGPGPHVRGCWAIDLLLGKV